MPELPEVECVKRGLARARFRGVPVTVWRSDFALRIGAHWRDENLNRIEGRTAGTVGRRGKYIVWRFGDQALVIHLGMSGRLVIANAGDVRVPHTHLVLGFEDAREVRFVDPRRFGGLRASPAARVLLEPPLAELGPEPLTATFDGPWLQAKAGRSKRAVRDVLLDQRVVAGVGNIYVSEALYRAGVHPLLAARRLRESAWSRVSDSVKTVLATAIKNGGTTLRDYRGTAGQRGRNQNALAVYGRGGERCSNCGATLRAFTHGGRSGVFCPEEQRRPRTRAVL